jgi:hypothetical protein
VWPYGLAGPQPDPLAASRSPGASCWSRDRSEDRPSTGPRCRSEKDALVSGSSSPLLGRRLRPLSPGGAEAPRGWPAVLDGPVPDGPVPDAARTGWVAPGGGVMPEAGWVAPGKGCGVAGEGGGVMLLTGWVAAYAGWTTVRSAAGSVPVRGPG